MAGAQAVDFRAPLKPSRGIQAAHEVIRKYVAHLEEDRPLYDDINTLKEVVERGEEENLRRRCLRVRGFFQRFCQHIIFAISVFLNFQRAYFPGVQ